MHRQTRTKPTQINIRCGFVSLTDYTGLTKLNPLPIDLGSLIVGAKDKNSAEMPEGLSSDIQLEIAHVLFIDIVGYSKLLIDEQRELQQQLNQVVRNTDQFRTAETVEKFVQLPTGDGIELVAFTSPIRSKMIRASKSASLANRRRRTQPQG